jgi:hypothetical protein
MEPASNDDVSADQFVDRERDIDPSWLKIDTGGAGQAREL